METYDEMTCRSGQLAFGSDDGSGQLVRSPQAHRTARSAQACVLRGSPTRLRSTIFSAVEPQETPCDSH